MSKEQTWLSLVAKNIGLRKEGTRLLPSLQELCMLWKSVYIRRPVRPCTPLHRRAYHDSSEESYPKRNRFAILSIPFPSLPDMMHSELSNNPNKQIQFLSVSIRKHGFVSLWTTWPILLTQQLHAARVEKSPLSENAAWAQAVLTMGSCLNTETWTLPNFKDIWLEISLEFRN